MKYASEPQVSDEDVGALKKIMCTSFDRGVYPEHQRKGVGTDLWVAALWYGKKYGREYFSSHALCGGETTREARSVHIKLEGLGMIEITTEDMPQVDMYGNPLSQLSDLHFYKIKASEEELSNYLAERGVEIK